MRIPKLAVLFALALPLSAEAALVDGYSDCEVKQVAAYWDTKPKKAAKRIKKMMQTGDKALWDAFGNAKYTPAQCRFDETPFTYADAEVLAQYWGFGGDVEGAKRFVEEKIATGGMDFVWAALYDASYAEKKVDPYAEEEYLSVDAFYANNFHYCDARVVAELWGMDTWQAKVAIGGKFVRQDQGALSTLPETLAQARIQAQQRGAGCLYYETNYGYEDAAAMAQLWRTDVESAKLRMADMVTKGRDGEIRQQLAIAAQNGLR